MAMSSCSSDPFQSVTVANLLCDSEEEPEAIVPEPTTTRSATSAEEPLPRRQGSASADSGSAIGRQRKRANQFLLEGDFGHEEIVQLALFSADSA